MKKCLFLVSAVLLLAPSCKTMSFVSQAPQPSPASEEIQEPFVKKNLLKTTSNQKKVEFGPAVKISPVAADLQISPNKIKYFMLVSESVRLGGLNNVISTAIWEALAANDNSDVLVDPQTQIKYDKNGEIESITVTGYPAKYVNFRKIVRPAPEYQLEIDPTVVQLKLAPVTPEE